MEWIIGLPALGHTAEGGTVREWLKAVGDTVAHAEPVVVVESDKASIEIEAPADGILIEISVEPGREVPTGTVLGKIAQARPPAGSASRGTSEQQVEARTVVVPSRSGRDVESASATDVRPTTVQKPRSTPLARRIAIENGLDIRALASGRPDGVIRKSDVLLALRRPPALVDRPAPKSLSAMRRAISRRMTEAWQKQPMVTLFRTIDVTRLSEWRSGQENAAGITAVFVAAMARVLTRHPQLNGTIENDQLSVGPDVNLAVAVALEQGLAAPVIHAAHAKSLAEIRDELDALIARSRQSNLPPADTEGATASLSNLGTFGISAFTPLLTPPQIAVLGLGAIDRVFRETDSGFAFRSELHVSLTFDHRAVDGADGARFLQELDALLQAPRQLALPAAAS